MTNELNLKFLFANHDGIFVTITVNSNILVTDLKTKLIEQWPENLDPVVDISRFRLICMGCGILKDKKTLEELNIPKFNTHPTPVNVAILPEGVIPNKDSNFKISLNKGMSSEQTVQPACCIIS